MTRPSTPLSRQWCRRRRRQGGVFAPLLAPLLLGLVLCMGVVLDVAQVYNRRTELQSVADSAALAAARALDGTQDGVDAAQLAARAAAEAGRQAYGGGTVTWDDAALSFGSAPDGGTGGWVGATAARAGAAPLTHWFARVDTTVLAGGSGAVSTPFLHSVDSDIATRSVVVRAVAGRTAINVVPLAICAMNADPAGSRSNGTLIELVEYGFRRGVGYNLLALNPVGPVAQRFLINPLETPPAALNTANFSAAVLNPFMCSGSMPMPGLPATVYVSPMAAGATPFAFAAQLNSRFGPGGGCAAGVGVADTNVRQYLPTPASANWWGSTPASPSGQTAASTTTVTAAVPAGRYQTKADLPTPPGVTITARDYGPLWAYSRPLSSTGTPFALGDWPALYPSTAPAIGASGYPASGTPYSNTFNTWFTTSSVALPRLANRRVLNVALLDCTLSTSPTATVLGVGRFFMTAAASAGAISGEFAGAAPLAALAGPVGLFQ